MADYEFTGSTTQLGIAHTNYVVAMKVDPTAATFAEKITLLAVSQADAQGNFTLQWQDWAGRIIIGSCDDDDVSKLDCKFHDWLVGVLTAGIPLTTIYATLEKGVSGSNVSVSGDTLTSNANSWTGSTGLAHITKTTGKYYFEVTISSATSNAIIGIGQGDPTTLANNFLGFQAGGIGYSATDGNKWVEGVSSAYSNTFTQNDVIGVAYDANTGKVWFAKNGVWVGDPVNSTGEAGSLTGGVKTYFGCSVYGIGKYVDANFGATAFTHSAPSGFESGVFVETTILQFNHPDLIAAYTMDNISGSTLVDESDNNSDGTITGAVQGGGVINQSLYFDGVDDKTTTPITFPATDDWAVSVWIKSPHDTGASGYFLSNNNGQASCMGLGVTTGGAVRLFLNGAPALTLDSSQVINDTSFTHVVIQRTGGSIYIYVDGVLNTSAVNSYPIDSATFQLGQNVNGTGLFKGNIDRLRIFDRALTQGEITLMYDEVPDVLSFDNANLVAAYTMDNISGSTLVDESSNNSNGTIVGASPGTGYLNNSLNGDGTHRVELPLGASAFSGEFSVSVWAKGSDNAADYDVFGAKNTTSGDAAFVVALLTDGTIRAGGRITNGGNFVPFVVSSVVGTTDWRHIVVTVSAAGVVSLYVDGVLEGASSAGNTPILGEEHALFNWNHTDTTGLVGDVDQFRLFDKALTQIEITKLYGETLELNTSILDFSHPNLTAAYTMDNISGSTLVDETGNYNGTITGASQVGGHLGQALLFNDPTHKVTITPPALSGAYSWSVWFNSEDNTATNHEHIFTYSNDDYVGVIALKKSIGTSDINIQHRDSSGSASQVTVAAPSGGEWVHFAGVWNGASLVFYINGVSVGTAAVSTIHSGANPTLVLGNRSTSDFHADGSIDQFRLFDKALTQSEITELYNETAAPEFVVVDFSHPNLVAAYTMDNVSGSTLIDESSNNYDGTITGAVVSNGQLSAARKFDGIDDYVTLPGALNVVRSEYSVSCWVHPNTVAGYIYQDRNVLIRIGDSEILRWDNQDGTGDYHHHDVSSHFATGEWAHLTITWDGVNFAVYKNGVRIASTDSTGTTADNFNHGYVGAYDSQAAFNYGNVDIDQLRIFDRVLTPEEVLTLCLEEPAILAFDHPNLVTAYTMSTVQDGNLIDETSNNHNGTIVGAIQSPGQLGRSLSFDGTDDDVNLPAGMNIARTAFSISAWVNWVSGEANIYQDTNGYISLNREILLWNNRTGTGDYQGEDISANFAPGEGWVHLVVVVDNLVATAYKNGVAISSSSITPANSVNDYSAGRLATIFRTGQNLPSGIKLDQFRLFDRALTAQEAATLSKESLSATDFDRTDLLAAYTMGNVSGTTLTDESANGNDGTISGAVLTNGHIGKALLFDGIDDYVDIGALSTFNHIHEDLVFSVSTWIKVTDLAANNAIISNAVSDGDVGIYYVAQNTGAMSVKVWTGGGTRILDLDSTTGILKDNDWHHVALVSDGTNVTHYFDGVAVGSGTFTGAASAGNATSLLSVGRWNSNASGNGDYLEGSISNLRIFDTALGGADITVLANESMIGSSLTAFNRTDLVAAYTMNNTDVSNVYDESPNANNLTRVNGTYEPGHIGQSYEVLTNGNTDGLINSSISGYSGGNISISAWAYKEANTDAYNEVIVGFSADALHGIFTVYRDFLSGQLRYQMKAAGNTTHFITTDLPPIKQWNHIAMTWDGVTMKAWLNGALVGSTAVNSIQTGAAYGLTISRHGNVNGLTFVGRIDHMRMFDRALTTQEVVALANETQDITSFGHPNLQVGFTMENVSGSTLTDETGNDNGTITGATQIVSHTGQALSFDGVDDYISISPTNIGAASTITTSLLFKIQPGAAGGGIFGARGLTNETVKFLVSNAGSGSISLIVSNSSTFVNRGASATGYDDGEWHHLVVSVDYITKDFYMYIDNALEFSGNGADIVNATIDKFELGANYTAQFFDGDLDQVRVFDRPLTIEEISELYFKDLAVFDDKHPNLVVKADMVANDATYYTNTAINGSSTALTIANSVPNGRVGKNGNGSDNNTSNNAKPNFSTALPQDSVDFSVSLWVNADTISGPMTPFAVRGNAASGNLPYLAVRVQDLGSGYKWALVSKADGDDSEYVNESSIVASTSTWYHIVVTSSVAGRVLYIDGAPVVTENIDWTSFPVDWAHAILGAYTVDGSNFGDMFDGVIDEVRIYDRALIPGEVTQLFTEFD